MGTHKPSKRWAIYLGHQLMTIDIRGKGPLGLQVNIGITDQLYDLGLMRSEVRLWRRPPASAT